MNVPRLASTLLAPLMVAAAVACAQTPPAPKVDPTPPPPPDLSGDPEVEPQVTIIRREDQVVEEVRIRGELRYIRVTPRGGRSYFLFPDQNGNTYIRRDSLDPTLKVPMWVLFSF
jgi:Protein of unknown function (DUF2782)